MRQSPDVPCKAKNTDCLTLCGQCLRILGLDNAFDFPPQ